MSEICITASVTLSITKQPCDFLGELMVDGAGGASNITHLDIWTGSDRSLNEEGQFG
jgi:hypothetical protein